MLHKTSQLSIVIISQQTINNIKIVEHDDNTAVHNTQPLAANVVIWPMTYDRKIVKYMTNALQQHTIY